MELEIEPRIHEIQLSAINIQAERLALCPDWYRGKEEETVDKILNWKQEGEHSRCDGFSGFVGEVLFEKACKDLGIEITPSSGYDDILGYDFSVGKGKKTMFFDVSINYKPEVMSEKIAGGKFPTLFLPWYIFGERNYYEETYLDKFLNLGEFNAREFLYSVLIINMSIYESLELFHMTGIMPENLIGKINPKCIDKVYINHYREVISLIRDIILDRNI